MVGLAMNPHIWQVGAIATLPAGAATDLLSPPSSATPSTLAMSCQWGTLATVFGAAIPLESQAILADGATAATELRPGAG